MLNFTCCAAQSQLQQAQLAALLPGITRGLEKECLRVDTQGHLARTPHPHALGSKLTHPTITTDYAESLLEFITPPSLDRDSLLTCLRDIHRYVLPQLGAESLWASSMPCVLGSDADIALAHYGSSNAARFKHVYREGLGLRYGRHMQTIAGVHYNWSLPESFWAALREGTPAQAQGAHLQAFVDERYFGLIRNFLRYGWLIPYLFGATPALCHSFLQGRPTDLPELVKGTLYGPHATSLRMSDLGYQNRAQSQLQVSFNSLAEYTRDLEAAIRTEDPYYATLGVRDGAHWLQLSANVLQIENEFYAGIRPKRIAQRGERPALALARYGVQYLEVRLFDLNPMVDIGVTPEQIYFADAFLLMCLFRDSPPITPREQAENDENKRRVVNRGRDPDLRLLVHNQEQGLRPLALDLLDEMQPFAQLLDTAYGNTSTSATLGLMRERVLHPDSTPSAQVLQACREHGGHFRATMAQTAQHRASLLDQPLDTARQQTFASNVTASWAEHAALEAQDQGSFEDYVAGYFA